MQEPKFRKVNRNAVDSLGQLVEQIMDEEGWRKDWSHAVCDPRLRLESDHDWPLHAAIWLLLRQRNRLS